MARSPRFTHAPPRLRRGGAALLAAGVLLAATGCGHDSPRKVAEPTTVAVRSTSTVEPSTSTTTPPTQEHQVKAAYLAAMAALFRSGQIPDPDNPSLAKTQVGPSLQKARQLLSSFKAAGIRLEFVDAEPPTPAVGRVHLTSRTSATANVCLVDNSRQVRVSDGRVMNDAVVSRSTLAELTMIDGVWLLRAQRMVQSWTDGKGCTR